MQTPNEEFFTLFSAEADLNIVERVAIPLAGNHGAEASPRDELSSSITRRGCNNPAS